MIIKRIPCSAVACNQRRDQGTNPIFCKWHWSHTPEVMQSAILVQRAIQVKSPFHVEYFRVCAEAVEYQAELEGESKTNPYRYNYEILSQAKGLKIA